MINYKQFLVLFLFLFSAGSPSAQPKRLYLAPDDHTDYMWTSTEEGYRKAFLETLDYYIDLNDSTASEPYAYQSKWNCDGSLWIYEYAKNRDEKQFARLIKQIGEGKITIPLNTVQSLMGIAPLEATLRDMYYAGSLERKYGLDFDLAMNMEDQVLPLGLSSLWAGAGAKYSWRGVCACATKVTGLDNRPNEVYWYKGLDDRKVLMKWYSVNPSMITNRKEYRYNLGNYLEASNQTNAIIDLKDLLKDTVRYPYDVAGAFGKGGDDLLTLTDRFPKIAKEYSDSEYQVIVSNEIDFFRDMEKNYGDQLPEETISWGSTEWGNSVASLAEVSASVKRSIEKLRTAEALYTLVALKDRTFASNLDEMKQKAWMACGLYFEHDWTADGPVTRKQRADWQRKIAGQLISYVDTLYNLSLEFFGTMIAKDDKYLETFFVFNSLSWERTDYSDYPYLGQKDIVVTDLVNSKEVPYQFITKKGKQYLRILASGIPSLGHKVFGIKRGVPTANSQIAAIVKCEVIENEYYRITIDGQGTITSLIDKKNNNRECISPVNKLYANDLGPSRGNALLNDQPLRVENTGPVSVTLVAESYRPVKHESRITLFGHIDRIELENYITQNTGDKIVTYSFSFNLENPEIWHEEAGAILKVKPVSEGGHYADSICRLDWIGLNHFADISDGQGKGMILSNRDAYFMKPGNSTVEKIDFVTPQINVLATGKIDNWLGIESQDGDSYFEDFFALKPYCNFSDAAESMKFSLEHQNPLVAGNVSGKSDTYGLQFSLINISAPGVFAWSVKPAEEGINQGVILRLWNMNNLDTDCTLSSPHKMDRAIKTTHIETDIEAIATVKGNIITRLGHNRIETFKIFPK